MHISVDYVVVAAAQEAREINLVGTYSGFAYIGVQSADRADVEHGRMQTLQV